MTVCLIVTPTHDAYLENGTDIGLTVGKFIVAYAGLLLFHFFVKLRPLKFVETADLKHFSALFISYPVTG